ncbi:UxaA family hydrolase [Chakrabartyella piscis]|uniref:UxaA family hydrolase n=1 Tax=Chakrabartyella piscis TaxID=2918914 RepID=UPI0029586DEF|nr:UxaA family hydrolase [Chakrabartyella piscis]
MMEFQGYLRADGTVGTRNYTVVLPTIDCANAMAKKIADGVVGAIPMLHNHACIRVGEDRRIGQETVIGIGKNPNVGAVLVVGIGCEPMCAQPIVDEIQKTGKPVDFVSIDKEGDYDTLIATGIAKLQELKAKADAFTREPCDVGKLIISIKCSASGTMSLISNNPVVGAAMDLLVQHGGTAIFSETAEILGAQQILKDKSVSEEVKKKIDAVSADMLRKIADAGVDILGSEPNQGNIQNGLTTIEEKSLGAVSKSGTTPLQDVLQYGEAPKGTGVYFMDGSSTSAPLFLGGFMVGSQVGIFTMGGGLPARFRGLPSHSSGFHALPTLKVLGSPAEVDVKDDFDIYTGSVITGEESIQELGRKLFEKIIAVAGGEEPVNEQVVGDYQEMLQVYAIGLLM